MKKISQSIIQMMEDFHPPWKTICRHDINSGFPVNVLTKKPYSGINPLLLNYQSEQQGFQSCYWGTYTQWAKMGCSVRRRPENHEGNWGTSIVFVDDKGKPNQACVFNAEQVFGPKVKGYRVQTERLLTESVADYNYVDEFIRLTSAVIKTDSESYYDRKHDCIHVPDHNSFSTIRQYYATVFHELIHWSEWRTGWEGDETLGELIAEIGTGYIEQKLSLPHCDDMTVYRYYLNEWLENMRKNSNYIFEAASQASKSVQFLFDKTCKENHEISPN